MKIKKLLNGAPKIPYFWFIIGFIVTFAFFMHNYYHLRPSQEASLQLTIPPTPKLGTGVIGVTAPSY
jgi:hypothetical protein